MTKLRSYEDWHASLRNFDWLGQHVSGAMDVDVLIECKGHFLVVEGKPWTKGVKMPYGQHKALYQLSKQPKTRVYLVGEGSTEGLHVALVNDAPKPRYLRSESAVLWPPERFVPTSREGFGRLVAAWWSDAREGRL